jgi:hypothetical protein
MARGTSPPAPPVTNGHFDILSSFTSVSNDGSFIFGGLVNTTWEIHQSNSLVESGDFFS